MNNKLNQAIALFDTYNQKDPNIFTHEGVEYPQEYFLSLQLHRWVTKLSPDASEELLLASRAQHIGRWEKPRNTYPMDKVGYLTWRKELSAYHAQKAAEILNSVGYDQATIERVSSIIKKIKIKADSEVQTIENALCLVFLQFQYEAFYPKHEADKVIEIIRKSLLKMDSKGHEQALLLPYSETGLALIQEALKGL